MLTKQLIALLMVSTIVPAAINAANRYDYTTIPSYKYLQRMSTHCLLAEAYKTAAQFPQPNFDFPPNGGCILPSDNWREDSAKKVHQYIEDMRDITSNKNLTLDKRYQSKPNLTPYTERYAQETIKLTVDNTLRPQACRTMGRFGANFLLGIATVFCAAKAITSAPTASNRQAWWKATTTFGGFFGLLTTYNVRARKEDYSLSQRCEAFRIISDTHQRELAKQKPLVN